MFFSGHGSPTLRVSKIGSDFRKSVQIFKFIVQILEVYSQIFRNRSDFQNFVQISMNKRPILFSFKMLLQKRLRGLGIEIFDMLHVRNGMSVPQLQGVTIREKNLTRVATFRGEHPMKDRVKQLCVTFKERAKIYCLRVRGTKE